MFRYMMYLSRYRLSPICNIFGMKFQFRKFLYAYFDRTKGFLRRKKKRKRATQLERRNLAINTFTGIPSCFEFILYAYNSLNGVMNYGATSTSAIIFSSTLSSLSRVSYLFPLSFLSFFIFLSFIVLPISSKSSTRTIFRVALHLDYKRLFSIL